MQIIIIENVERIESLNFTIRFYMSSGTNIDVTHEAIRSGNFIISSAQNVEGIGEMLLDKIPDNK